MKTIGFIDYYISEWHANNYPAWIEEACKNSGKDFCVKYAWAEEYVSPVDGRNTDEWCTQFGVEKCETIAELCEKSDYIIILAPSNPEKHLGYAKEALKYSKNTYIDKTFAPDSDIANEIFDIAKTYNTKFFSTSALRYATELKDLKDVKSIMTFGGGSNLLEYIIHQIEMVVKVTNLSPAELKLEKEDSKYIIRVKSDDDKSATMIFAPELSFAAYIDDMSGISKYIPIQSGFFKTLISEILCFFETGEYPFDPAQTLDVMKIRSGVLSALDNPDKWIKLL